MGFVTIKIRQSLAGDGRIVIALCEFLSSQRDSSSSTRQDPALKRWATVTTRDVETLNRHGSIEFLSSKNLLLLADSKTDEIIDVMKHGRRNKNQAIEPVEDSAMTRNEF